jgi:hypothetical protein
MGQSRYFSSVAEPTTLTSAISNTATTIPLESLTGYPINYPYTIALDYGTSLEELCDVTSAAGLNVNVTRAVDSTSAAAHALGANVRHVSSARDFTEYDTHVNTDNGVHGIVSISDVVGTTDVQTLTNKTLVDPVINGPIPNMVIGPSSGVGATTLTVQGLTGQTADLIYVENAASTGLIAVNPVGDVVISPVDTATNVDLVSINPTAPTAAQFLLALRNNGNLAFGVQAEGNTLVKALNTVTTPLTVTAPTGSATDVADFYAPSGNLAFAVQNTGGIAVTNSTTTAVPLTVNAPTGQSANLASFEVNSTQLFGILPSGGIINNGPINGNWVGYSTSNTTRTSNTTLTADTFLTIPLGVPGTYAIDGIIFYNGANGSSDIKYQFQFTGTLTNSLLQLLAPAVAGSTLQPAVVSAAVGTTLTSGTFGTPSLIGMRVNGTVVVSAFGSLTFYWAQNTSNATATTVMQGSYIRATRIV